MEQQPTHIEELATEDGQAVLFSSDTIDLTKLDQPAAAKRFTAESLQRNRAKRDAIIRALAEGQGLLRIARAFGVSHHTVAALRDSRPDLVAIEKEQLSRNLGRVMSVCLERFEEGVVDGKVHPGQLPVGFGILADKKALLDGEATIRVERVQRHEVSLELVAGYLAKRGIALPAIDVESGVVGHLSAQNDVDTNTKCTPSGILAESGATISGLVGVSQFSASKADTGDCDTGGGGGGYSGGCG